MKRPHKTDIVGISTLVLFLVILLSGCVSLPKGSYVPATKNTEIDYSRMENWAAHPAIDDHSDLIPEDLLSQDNDTLPVDIFFLHPTIYTGKKGENSWNAAIDNEKLNKRVDESTIQYQASIFNQTGRVYAPRYRQAHLHTFYTKDTTSAKQALDFAFKDVEKAFAHYWKHENKGRPLIIASHSQGAYHAMRIIKKYFDGSADQNKLIAAYLIGFPVKKNFFKNIKVCQSPTDTQCFCSWRTFKRGHIPGEPIPTGNDIVVVNPLNWSTQADYVDKAAGKGGILRKFDKVLKNILGAEIYQGLLWVDKPKFPWSFLITTKNYHVADMNLFYVDIAENARTRSKVFLDIK